MDVSTHFPFLSGALAESAEPVFFSLLRPAALPDSLLEEGSAAQVGAVSGYVGCPARSVCGVCTWWKPAGASRLFGRCLEHSETRAKTHPACDRFDVTLDATASSLTLFDGATRPFRRSIRREDPYKWKGGV